MRYRGTDQAYAVNELFQRLKQEITQQKMRNVRQAAGGTGGKRDPKADLVESGKTLTDKERIIAKTPGGFAWNGYLVENCVGKGGLTYAAAHTAYVALAAGEKTAWNSAAIGLSPALAQVYQTIAGGTAGTPLTAGEVFYIYRYGLSQMGLASAPTATPPTYA